jgi:hypothetical protein
MTDKAMAEQAAQMEPLATLPVNAAIWVMAPRLLDLLRREADVSESQHIVIAGVELRLNPDMPRNRVAAVDRDGNVLGVIELDIAPSHPEEA